MSFSDDLAQLYSRDLTKLIQEIEAFHDEAAIWMRTGGVTNSSGNLALHLEGNLREYIGRQLGGLPYVRNRDLEFSSKGVPVSDLLARLTALREMIPSVVSGLDSSVMETHFPETVLGRALPTGQFLIHLLGHLNYHLGQIDYLRRVLTGQTAISFASL